MTRTGLSLSLICQPTSENVKQHQKKKKKEETGEEEGRWGGGGGKQEEERERKSERERGVEGPERDRDCKQELRENSITVLWTANATSRYASGVS